MVDFSIDPRLYQRRDWTDPIAKGFGLVNQMQTAPLKQQALELEMQREKRLGEHQAAMMPGQLQKQQLEAIKPALDYGYAMADAVMADPSKFPQVREMMIKLAPPLAAGFPTEYSPEVVNKFKTSYERMKKLEDPYKAAGLDIKRQELEIKRKEGESKEDFRKRTLGLRGAEVGIHAGAEQRKAGEKPSFADFQKDPAIAALPYNQQVARFNQSIAEGKAIGTGAKPLTPKQKSDADKAKAKVDLIRKLGGTPPSEDSTTHDEMPPASDNKDKYLTGPNGQVYKSDGTKWNIYAGE